MRLQVYLPATGAVQPSTNSPVIAASQARAWVLKGWSPLIIERRDPQPTLDGTEGGEPDVIVEITGDMSIRIHSGDAPWINTVRTILARHG